MTEEERLGRLAFALTEAMKRKRLSARELAKRLGRDPATVNRWAKGQAAPSILVARELADALGVRVELLVDPPVIPNYPIDDYLIPEEVDRQQQELARGAAALGREDLEREEGARRAAADARVSKRDKRPA